MASESTGWYPHPTAPELERYWDGTAWTEERRLQAPQQLTPPSKAPNRRTLAIGAVAVLAVAAIGAALALGGGGGPEPASTGNETNTTKATAAPTTEPAVDDADYREVTEWEFQQVVAYPEAHAGEKYRLYGQVVELDAANGSFLARIGPVQRPSGDLYKYEVDVALDSPDDLAEFSETDGITLWVEVVGPGEEYDGQAEEGAADPLRFRFDRVDVIDAE